MAELITPFFLVLGLFSLLVLLIYILFGRPKHKHRYHARPLMTGFESGMFMRLKQAFPEHHLCPQVAFSALITNDDLRTRSQFNRKVTDFVLLNERLEVVAIIELDDPSHLDKVEEDAFRDHMLNYAGYKVYRYTDIPSVRQLRKDILGHNF